MPRTFMMTMHPDEEIMGPEHLREAGRQLSMYARSLVEVSPDPLIAVNAEGKITDVNGKTERLTGLERQKLIGSDLSLYLEEKGKAAGILRSALAGSSVSDVPVTFMHASGARTDTLLSAVPYEDGSGAIIGTLLVARDFTLLKEAMEALEAANKELEAFSYSVSHDLRAPLRAIDGFSMMLEEHAGPRLDDESRRIIAVIRKNAKSMGALIDDLLQFSRFSRQSMNLVDTDMRQMVQETLDELADLTKGRDVRFSVGNLPPAPCDPALMRHVWRNLLENAVKYTRKEPVARIGISGETRDGMLLYTVQDNGIGFDQRYADKLFGVFQRLHDGTEFEGTGVGLAIVARIVARHGGHVAAAGVPGEGATFSFDLPMRPAAEDPRNGAQHIF